MENFRLRVFRSVAQHRNFRVAGEELLLTQPAVSQQVKALEAELGTALFRRSGGQVMLTDAGEILLPYAERLAALAAEAEAAVHSAVGKPAGTLSVGASQTIGQYLLPQWIATFVAAYPAVSIATFTGNTGQVVEALLDGRTHIGLIEGPAMRSGVRVEPFAQDELVLVAPAGHPWADERVATGMLSEATLLMREQGSGSRRVAERALMASGVALKTLQIGMTLDSTQALLSAVEAGLGLAFVSRWAVRNQFALRTLRPVHVDGLKLTRPLSVATVSGPEPEGPAGAFRSFLLRTQQPDGSA